MSLRNLWACWKNFWFAPESALSICVFRILFGIIMLVYCLLLYPDLLNWYGTHGICTPQTSHEVLALLGPPGLNIRGWLPPGDIGIIILFWLLAAAFLFVTVGLQTRISCACVYLVLATLQQQNSLIINGGDILLKMAAFYLVLAPAGRCLSLDNLRNKKKRPSQGQATPAAPSGWPQRLYRLQIALIYFQAFWTKLEDTNWLNGTAIYYVLHDHEYLRFPVACISDNLWMCQTLTWGTLLVEGAMWSLVWFKETRYFVLAGVLLLHLGIEYTMNLPTFESITIASLVVFIPSEDLQAAYNKLRAAFIKVFVKNNEICE